MLTLLVYSWWLGSGLWNVSSNWNSTAPESYPSTVNDTALFMPVYGMAQVVIAKDLSVGRLDAPNGADGYQFYVGWNMSSHATVVVADEWLTDSGQLLIRDGTLRLPTNVINSFGSIEAYHANISGNVAANVGILKNTRLGPGIVTFQQLKFPRYLVPGKPGTVSLVQVNLTVVEVFWDLGVVLELSQSIIQVSKVTINNIRWGRWLLARYTTPQNIAEAENIAAFVQILQDHAPGVIIRAGNNRIHLININMLLLVLAVLSACLIFLVVLCR